MELLIHVIQGKVEQEKVINKDLRGSWCIARRACNLATSCMCIVNFVHRRFTRGENPPGSAAYEVVWACTLAPARAETQS
jgi:hypothetical protein